MSYFNEIISSKILSLTNDAKVVYISLLFNEGDCQLDGMERLKDVIDETDSDKVRECLREIERLGLLDDLPHVIDPETF